MYLLDLYIGCHRENLVLPGSAGGRSAWQTVFGQLGSHGTIHPAPAGWLFITGCWYLLVQPRQIMIKS